MVNASPPSPAWAEIDDAAVIQRSWTVPETFSVVFERHAARLHRYVALRIGDANADDVVSDTFLAAFRQRREFDTTRAEARPGCTA